MSREDWLVCLREAPELLRRKFSNYPTVPYKELTFAPEPKEFEALCQAIESDPADVTQLYLRQLALTPEQWEQLNRALAHNTHMTDIMLYGSPASEEQLHCFARSVADCPTLVHVDLSQMKLDDSHLEAVRCLLQKRLQFLSVALNFFSADALYPLLNEALSQNICLHSVGVYDAFTGATRQDDATFQHLLRRNQWLREYQRELPTADTSLRVTAFNSITHFAAEKKLEIDPEQIDTLLDISRHFDKTTEISMLIKLWKSAPKAEGTHPILRRLDEIYAAQQDAGLGKQLLG